MNYYPHHIGDFDKATRHLTRLERSIYLDLLHVYYDTESPLINDLKTLCRKIIATSKDEADAVETMLNEFFFLTPDGWENDRCNEVVSEYQKRVNDASKAGKASAKARKANRLKASKGSTPVQRPFNEGSTNQEPKPVTKTITKQDKTYVCFERFWSAYPKKTDKKKALTIWNRIKPSEDTFLLITNHLNLAYCDTPKNFIPNPTTYLNGEKWTDEIITQGFNQNDKPMFDPNRDYVTEALDELAEKKRLLSELDS